MAVASEQSLILLGPNRFACCDQKPVGRVGTPDNLLFQAKSNSDMVLVRAYLPSCSGYPTCRGAVTAARPEGSQVWAKVQSKPKLVTVKRSGRNKKVAVSHFGKRQLKLPGSPDKVEKTEHPVSSQRSNTDTGQADSGGKQAQPRSTTPQNVLVTTQPAVKLRPVISKDGTRQELHQTIKLYRVPASSLRAASQFAQSPRQHQCQHKKAKQEKHRGQQPKTQGQAQVGTVEQISTAKVSRQQVPTPGEKTSKREKQRIVRLGKSLLPNGADKRNFAAAGVIVTSFGKPDGHLRVLMAQEKNRTSKMARGMVQSSARRDLPYGLLGGKRKPRDDTPQATALRELSEETAGLLNKHTVKLADTAVFVGGGSMYYIFFCMLEDQDNLPEKFAQRIANPSAVNNECDTASLAWVPLRELARWPRSCFFDMVMRSTAVPARLCLQQQEHDRKTLLTKS